MDCVFWISFGWSVYYAQKIRSDGMMKNKRGELTTQQLVTIIVLIVSFVIILFLLFRLGLGEETNKEICHNSVLLKSKSSLGGSLDCKTNYVCISGGGKCDGFSEDYLVKVDLSGTEAEAKNETMKAIADEMADCWWMFGEGKVDYTKGIDWGKVTGKKACSICSTLSFDKEIREFTKSNIIHYNNLYVYLQSTKKNNAESYLSYMYNTNNLDKFKGDNYLLKPFNFNGKYFIVTGISEKGGLNSVKDFFFGSVDDFNKAFFDFVDLPEVEGKEEYGHIPVIVASTPDLDKLNCGEFITKA
ncbi:MAG: hypothetical protein ABIA78_00270 [archaeon]